MKKLIEAIINLKLWIWLMILGTFTFPTMAFAVIQNLNGQNGMAQSFANDTNVTITSASNIHSLGWTGTLPVSKGGTGTNIFSNGSILFSNGTSITQDNSNLFWDTIANVLRLGGGLSTGADSIIHSLTVGLGGGSVSSNTAVGGYALESNTTGYNNTAVGSEALRNQGAGGDSTAVGYKALEHNTTGSDQNTAVGSFALRFNTTGRYNTAQGMGALRANTTQYGNTAVGQAALFNATAANNTAIGWNALNENLTGSDNVAIGQGAVVKQADGSTNLTTPQRSVYVGTQVQGYDNNDDNSIVIGYRAIGAGANKAVIGNSSVTDVYLGSSAGLANIHAANVSTVTSGASAPASTPTALGQMYIDTSATKVYISTGTLSSADWTIMN